MNPGLRLIGAPCDLGASRRGASMGPEALRAAGLGEALLGLGLRVRDAGNLSGPMRPLPDPAAAAGRWRHLDELGQWNRAVFDAATAALRDDERPVLLGGDHSLAAGAIAAVAAHCRARARKLRVLWLDAHADCNTAETSPSGNLHGAPLAWLCGLGPAALLRAPQPALDPHSLRLIGVRAIDPAETRLVEALGLSVFGMEFVNRHGMLEAMRRALEGVDRETHLHVSLDCDFLDPSYADATGAAVPGGPSHQEAMLCMDMIAASGAVGSLDVMELNPALDSHNRSAGVLVGLLARMLDPAAGGFTDG